MCLIIKVKEHEGFFKKFLQIAVFFGNSITLYLKIHSNLKNNVSNSSKFNFFNKNDYRTLIHLLYNFDAYMYIYQFTSVEVSLNLNSINEYISIQAISWKIRGLLVTSLTLETIAQINADLFSLKEII